LLAVIDVDDVGEFLKSVVGDSGWKEDTPNDDRNVFEPEGQRLVREGVDEEVEILEDAEKREIQDQGENQQGAFNARMVGAGDLAGDDVVHQGEPPMRRRNRQFHQRRKNSWRRGESARNGRRRGDFEKRFAERDPKAVELFESMEEVKREAAEFMRPRVNWQFFEAEADGEAMHLFASGAVEPLQTFRFSRRRAGDFLRLSDYALPPQNGKREPSLCL